MAVKGKPPRCALRRAASELHTHTDTRTLVSGFLVRLIPRLVVVIDDRNCPPRGAAGSAVNARDWLTLEPSRPVPVTSYSQLLSRQCRLTGLRRVVRWLQAAAVLLSRFFCLKNCAGSSFISIGGATVRARSAKGSPGATCAPGEVSLSSRVSA